MATSSSVTLATDDFDGDDLHFPDQLAPLSPLRDDDGENRMTDVFDPAAADKVDLAEGNLKRRSGPRQPRPKLDPTRLIGARGIPALKKTFEKVKFKGAGNEVEDLNKLMLTMEHWAHRLFPAMNFDEFIDRCEFLGGKKPIQRFMQELRQMGDFQEAEDDTSVVRRENDNIEDDAGMVDEDGEGETNLILDRTVPQRCSVDTQSLSNDQNLISSLMSSAVATDAASMRSEMEISNTPLTPVASHSPTTGLTPNQMKRIEENRKKAQEKRLSRLTLSQQITAETDGNEMDTSSQDDSSTITQGKGDCAELPTDRILAAET